MIGGVGCVASAEGEARFICAVAIRLLAQVSRTKHRDVWGGGSAGVGGICDSVGKICGASSSISVVLVYNSLTRIMSVRLCGVSILAPTLPVFGY